MILRRLLTAGGLVAACCIFSAAPAFASTVAAQAPHQHGCARAALTSDHTSTPGSVPSASGAEVPQTGNITSYNGAQTGPLPPHSDTVTPAGEGSHTDVDFDCDFGQTAVIIYSVPYPGPIYYTIYGITNEGEPVVSYGYFYCGGINGCTDEVQESVPAPNTLVSYVEIEAPGNDITINGHFCL